MIFLPKLGPFGANMGPGDPRVRPPPGAASRTAFRPGHCQVGPHLVYVGAGALYIGFLCQMGPSCKCNARCDLLWFLLRILSIFILFRTCTPRINKSRTLVEFVSNNPYYYC